MKKIVPDPPENPDTQPTGENANPSRLNHATLHVLAAYRLLNAPDTESFAPSPPLEKVFNVRPDLSAEEALTTAYELLDGAGAIAYEAADNLDSTHRKLGMSLVHLIEMAQTLVDSVLTREQVLKS